jgi:hypothetical protein
MDIPWPTKIAERARRSFWSTDRSVIIECSRVSSKRFPRSIECSTLVSGTTFLNCGMAQETIFQSPTTLRMWVYSFKSWLLVQSTCWVILAAVSSSRGCEKLSRMQMQSLSFPKRKRIWRRFAFHSKLFADFRQDVAKGDIEGGTARFINRLTGNKDYAKDNGSYGLTSLRSRHVAVARSELRFNFKGKSGKIWRLQVKNPRGARVVKACRTAPVPIYQCGQREPGGNVL